MSTRYRESQYIADIVQICAPRIKEVVKCKKVFRKLPSLYVILGLAKCSKIDFQYWELFFCVRYNIQQTRITFLCVENAKTHFSDIYKGDKVWLSWQVSTTPLLVHTKGMFWMVFILNHWNTYIKRLSPIRCLNNGNFSCGKPTLQLQLFQLYLRLWD